MIMHPPPAKSSMPSHWYPTLQLIFTFSFPKLFIFAIFIFSNEIMLAPCYRMDLMYPPQTYIVKACSVCTMVVPGGSKIFQTWGLGERLQVISGMFLKEIMDLSLLFLPSSLLCASWPYAPTMVFWLFQMIKNQQGH